MLDAPMLRTNRPQWFGLHPLIYRLLIGAVLWLFAAVWLFFSHSPYAALQLVIVAAFLLVFVGVPWVISRIAREKARPERCTFADWRAGDLMTLTGPLKAGEAAIAILLAPLAALVGITAISAIAYMAAIGVL